MSTQITTAFVQQFTRGIEHLAEQKMSRFRPAVRVEMIGPGDRAYFDQLGSVSMTLVSDRHADTPLSNTPHSRRMVMPAPYDYADLVDKPDKIRTLNDPTNDYVIAGARASGRQMDDLVIAAAFGTAQTGVAGATSETWASLTANWTINSGNPMTLAAIITANKKLREAENDPEDGFFFAVSQEQFEDMLNDTTITSADYNSVRALMSGEIKNFMGFTWIGSERLGTDASSYRRCIAWWKNALLLAVATDPSGRISERSDKRYAVQVYYSMDAGATRMSANGVVEVLCSE